MVPPPAENGSGNRLGGRWILLAESKPLRIPCAVLERRTSKSSAGQCVWCRLVGRPMPLRPYPSRIGEVDLVSPAPLPLRLAHPDRAISPSNPSKTDLRRIGGALIPIPFFSPPLPAL